MTHKVFVGCGNMGQAMLAGWLLAGEDPASFTVVRPSGRAVPPVQTVTRLGELDRAPDRLILGFKPQQLPELTGDVARWAGAGTVVISMLAGADMALLRRLFPAARAVVRVMPNLPVAIRRGVVPAFPSDDSDALRAELHPWFASLGFSPWCTSEEAFAAYGFVAGSAPAYVARFIAAFAAAGEARGLASDVALATAREAVLGSAWLAASTGLPPAELARQVTSPGGTTEAGLKVFDAELPGLVERTLAAAAARSAEMRAQIEA